MRQAALLLSLTHEQARRLHGYIQAYRSYALTSLAPSTTRNTALRMLQGLQARLIALLDQPAALVLVPLRREELITLHTSIETLRLLVFQQPATAQHEATCADLAGLKTLLESWLLSKSEAVDGFEEGARNA